MDECVVVEVARRVGWVGGRGVGGGRGEIAASLEGIRRGAL